MTRYFDGRLAAAAEQRNAFLSMRSSSFDILSNIADCPATTYLSSSPRPRPRHDPDALSVSLLRAGEGINKKQYGTLSCQVHPIYPKLLASIQLILATKRPLSTSNPPRENEKRSLPSASYRIHTMAPSTESRFLEGSMNDRVSAVPPSEFLLGPDAMDADHYAKKFALDWKPPDLDPESAYNNINSRSSFVSTRSGGVASSALTRIGTGASGSVWSKAPKQHGSSSTMASSLVGAGAPNAGFFSRVVGGRFGLTRSKSSFDVHDVEEEQGDDDDRAGGGGGVLGSFIPPVLKHRRSESVNSGAMATSGFFKREASDIPPVPSKKSSTKGAAAAAVDAPTALPGFDPTRRPTRDEITANYQSLLASGFFGTHAIQSTRFAAPGQRAQPPPQPPQAAVQDEDERSVYEDASHHPPSPERQPPPPPPSRLAPPPPPPPLLSSSSMAMDTDSPSSEAIPVSPTIIFHPTMSQQRPSSESMPLPPPTVRPQAKPKSKPDHKANLSFSAIPYSSTRPGVEPSIVDRPFRPPPVSLARFSMESSGRRSCDVPQPPRPALRGIKRPFTAAPNGSQVSVSTMGTMDGRPKGSMDYHGNAFTSGINEEDKPESGARKLVKKLRKSASRISIDLGNKTRQISISRMAPPPDVRDDDDDKMMGMSDDCQGNNNNTAAAAATTTTTATSHLAPSARTSMSSTVRRSFSWKFGKLGPGNKDQTTTTATESDNSLRGAGAFSLNNNNNTPAGFVLNNTGSNRTTPFALHAPVTFSPQQSATTATTPPANQFSNFSFLTGGGNDDSTHGGQQQESHLKKRELRGRRLRKHGSPLKQSPSPMPPHPPSPTRDDAMDWNENKQAPPGSPNKIRRVDRSRSRSRSNVIRVLHDSQHNSSSRAGSERGFTITDGGMPATMTTSADRSVFCTSTASKSRPPSRDNNGDHAMEGVEFSFHFPGRMRPTSSAASPANNAGVGGGGSLADVPDTNRGAMMMMVSGGAVVEGGGRGMGMGMGAGTTTTTATVKEMMMPRYSGRWVIDEDQEDMIF